MDKLFNHIAKYYTVVKVNDLQLHMVNESQNLMFSVQSKSKKIP